MTKIVLVVAAHSDDEALGCGGTIARHAAEGDQVHILFLADGVMSRVGVEASELDQRKAAANAASEILGIKTLRYVGLPDNRLDTVAMLDIVRPIEAAIHELSPEVVYTHHFGDLNVDHRQAHQAVMTACRPQPGTTVREIFTFEVPSSTEWASPGWMPFLPNVFIDIGFYLESKLAALSAYGTEMREPPHSRSMKHVAELAAHHGANIGVDAAEAFMAMRVIR